MKNLILGILMMLSFGVTSQDYPDSIVIKKKDKVYTVFRTDSIGCVESEIYIEFSYSGGKNGNGGTHFEVGYVIGGVSYVMDTIIGVTLDDVYLDTILVGSSNVTLYAVCPNCNSDDKKNYKITNIKITINCLSTLPIKLTSFTVANKLRVNTLYWETATQTNNDYFTMEHSSDGFKWDIINKLQGAGSSTSLKSYSIEHRDYPNAINYYRLTQTDYDGKSETFPVISIDNLLDVRLLKRVNTMGQEVDVYYRGIVIEVYSDGSTIKRVYR